MIYDYWLCESLDSANTFQWRSQLLRVLLKAFFHCTSPPCIHKLRTWTASMPFASRISYHTQITDQIWLYIFSFFLWWIFSWTKTHAESVVAHLIGHSFWQMLFYCSRRICFWGLHCSRNLHFLADYQNLHDDFEELRFSLTPLVRMLNRCCQGTLRNTYCKRSLLKDTETENPRQQRDCLGNRNKASQKVHRWKIM